MCHSQVAFQEALSLKDMHILYTPETPKFYLQYFQTMLSEQPQYQLGLGILPWFEGYTPYQRGGGIGNIFRSLFRMILPTAKSAAATVGKQALSTGAQIASDLVQGRDIKEAFLD